VKSVEEQFELISRGCDQIEPREELRKKLKRSVETGKPLRIKYGIDPTGFDVHLGHTVPLRKLKLFQELGHTAVLIIGTATAAVGDPSGRDEARTGLSPEQIEKNATSYLEQISKVIDVSRAEVIKNGQWFSRWGFSEMLRLLGKTTVQRMLERDDFSKRFRSNPSVPIYLHECLYPLMQGHDSVEIRADVELGGTEQLFNLMVGRDLQRDAGQEPQICLTMPILRGTDGVKKMGKTAGNYIGLNEPGKEQFGKTMRIPDELLKEWFTLLTDRPASEIDQIVQGHPNEAKKLLAADIVTFYHGSESAQQVRSDWDKQFAAGPKQDPDQIDEITLSPEVLAGSSKVGIMKLLVGAGLVKSNGEARQKINEGAVNFGPDRTKVTDAKLELDLSEGVIVRLGRKIVRVKG
jgi:tyrosyl-tRNA synthetase